MATARGYQLKMTLDFELAGGYWRIEGRKVQWSDRYGRIWWDATESCRYKSVRDIDAAIASGELVQVDLPA